MKQNMNATFSLILTTYERLLIIYKYLEGNMMRAADSQRLTMNQKLAIKILNTVD